jgi:hypothetical protein
MLTTLSISRSSNRWQPYAHGSTLGKSGPEEGVVLLDEEHGEIARITLEEKAGTTRYAITCHIKGWIAHTHYSRTSQVAFRDYEMMKAELVTMEQLSVSDMSDMMLPLVMMSFVERYP